MEQSDKEIFISILLLLMLISFIGLLLVGIYGPKSKNENDMADHAYKTLERHYTRIPIMNKEDVNGHLIFTGLLGILFCIFGLLNILFK